MSDSQTHDTPQEALEPFTGDRGWKGTERSPGEGVFFAAVLALVVIAVLAGLIGGAAGVGMLFVLLAFATTAILLLISIGQ